MGVGPEHRRRGVADFVELALKGPMYGGENAAAARWEELRAPVWERWLRDADRDWPPHAAHHDGIIGEVLRVRFNPPEGYVGGWDSCPRIVELAETGLAEIEAFWLAHPTAAASIEAPLAVYEDRLRAVLKRPETRLLAGRV